MHSKKLFQLAEKHIPSGVNSPVRAFKAVGGDPVFIQSGKGAYITSEEGKRYLDLCASWGALIFGHSPEGLIREVTKVLKQGTSFGAATHREVELAQRIHQMVPSMEKIRLVSSGTEAAMSAIRLARGFTSRKKIVKIDGGYHGHVDSLLVKAGSGLATFGLPDSAGVPDELAKLTLSVPFNDIEAAHEVYAKYGQDIAALILEPIPANMGVVLPKSGYLEGLRDLTCRYQSLLIFDEVISGFRVNLGGAQRLYKILPDLTCLGKVLGGGFPLAAFGGDKKIMDQLAPNGPVYQAGTLSGNPIAVSAALWMLRELQKKKGNKTVIDQLNEKSGEFFQSLRNQISKNAYPVALNSIASMFTLFFTDQSVTDYRSAKTSDTAQYAAFFHYCLKQGIYLAPAQFEANFISTAHRSSDLKWALKVFLKALKTVTARPKTRSLLS